MKRQQLTTLVLVFANFAWCTPLSAQVLTQASAREALHKVIDFYRTNVGYQGAYLWRYSADLEHQEGEGIASPTSGWTQPPGSPSVGEAYLESWRLSGEQVCLEAAVEVAQALVRSQLESGGWSSHFDLGPAGRKQYAYRVSGKGAGKNNRTTFDDNKSQSALSLLMHVDEALNFQNESIHEAVNYALGKMLAAQYPNGAWPQQYSRPPDPQQHPVRKASYPESWSREHPGRSYIGYYTLNDNNMSRLVDTLLEAHRIYDRDDCYKAALKTGEFFLLAQMPEPQPGWAQQYNRQMHPAWARKFEPPSITGGESQQVMRTLLKLYRHTGQARFIETLPRAIEYYRNSELPDGQLARFYELNTNRPLYFTKDYELTYSDADMPTHYAFKVGSSIDSIEREYQHVLGLDANELKPDHRPTTPVSLTDQVAKRARRAYDALDERGAWVEEGTMRHQTEPLPIIDMRTFQTNLKRLAAFVGATESLDE